jgi:hypothetical protein
MFPARGVPASVRGLLGYFLPPGLVQVSCPPGPRLVLKLDWCLSRWQALQSPFRTNGPGVPGAIVRSGNSYGRDPGTTMPCS